MTDNLPEKSATEQELSTLNLIVSQYLDFAELQARGRKLMYMADWKTKLDAFLALNDQDYFDRCRSRFCSNGQRAC